MDVLKQVENKFLNRKEVHLKILHKDAPTPSRDSLKSEIAKNLKADIEKIDIRYIFSQKNRDYSLVKVFLKL